MNYIGSKYGLLEHITAILKPNRVPVNGAALDLFAGTGAVAQLLKRRGHITYANDWQHYSYLTNVAFLEYNTMPRFNRLRHDPDFRVRVHPRVRDHGHGRPKPGDRYHRHRGEHGPYRAGEQHDLSLQGCRR